MFSSRTMNDSDGGIDEINTFKTSVNFYKSERSQVVTLSLKCDILHKI